MINTTKSLIWKSTRGNSGGTWVKAQIKRARLIENKDFVALPQKGVGGQFDSIEYHLTIEASKHIAMLCGTDKGFEVRASLTSGRSSRFGSSLLMLSNLLQTNNARSSAPSIRSLRRAL